MVYTKLELPGDVQEQPLSSALLITFSEKFRKLHIKNIFTGVVICQDAGLDFATLSEMRVQHSCFVVKFVNFL